MKNSIKTNSPKAWLLAARPKTLTAAVTPVVVGTVLATVDGHFRLFPALMCFTFAGMMQIAANLINDLFDFRRGADGESRLGPERACTQGWITPHTMITGISITLVIACIIGEGILVCTAPSLPFRGWELMVVGGLCVAFTFLYTTWMSRRAMGDILVIVFFGLVPVCGTYYVQTTRITIDCWIAATTCGLGIDTLLVVNNYRDRYQDRANDKRTLISMLGSKFGEWFYLILGISAAALCLHFVPVTDTWSAIIPVPYLWAHIDSWQRMRTISHGRALNTVLVMASRNILLLGASLCFLFLLTLL